MLSKEMNYHIAGENPAAVGRALVAVILVIDTFKQYSLPYLVHHSKFAASSSSRGCYRCWKGNTGMGWKRPARRSI